MSTKETLADAVDFWAKQEDTNDQLVQIVSEFGDYDSQSLECHTVRSSDQPEMRFYTGDEINQEAIQVVEEFMREYQPPSKFCYDNAVALNRFDSRFGLVEGVTASRETSTVHDHAWNTLNGLPIDVTRNSCERYGVRIPNHILQDAIPVLEGTNNWSLLTNPSLDSSLLPPYDNGQAESREETQTD